MALFSSWRKAKKTTLAHTHTTICHSNSYTFNCTLKHFSIVAKPPYRQWGQVLCVDVGPEMGSEWLGAGSGGSSTTRMRVVQAALSGFVLRKSSFNPRVRRNFSQLFMLLLLLLFHDWLSGVRAN